jgi:hypothetical protein
MLPRALCASAIFGLRRNAAPKGYTNFNAANLRSILVVSVVNNSVDVTAPDYLLSAVSIPVAELGYYVFQGNLIKRTLEDDGLSDTNLVHAESIVKFASYLAQMPPFISLLNVGI